MVSDVSFGRRSHLLVYVPHMSWFWSFEGSRSSGLVLIIMRDGFVAMLGLTLRWSARMRNPWVLLFSHFGPVILMCNGWSCLQAAPYLEMGHWSFARKSAGMLCKSVWLGLSHMALSSRCMIVGRLRWSLPMRVNVSLLERMRTLSV